MSPPRRRSSPFGALSSRGSGGAGSEVPTASQSGPLVLKLGGAALSEPDRAIDYVVRSLRVHREVVVVVSARAGITDAIAGWLAAPPGGRQVDALLDRLRRRHAPIDPEVERCLGSMRYDLEEIPAHRRSPDPIGERLVAYGERVSARWFASLLRARRLAAVTVDADRAGLACHAGPDGPRVDLDRSEREVRGRLGPLLRRGNLPVVTGFIARGPDGAVRTLGRGGSDASATAIGAALRACRVELVKQRYPVLDADPTIVPEARWIPRLGYEEAGLLARCGARVLHWDVARLAAERRLEVHVVSLTDPSRRTVIGARGPGEGFRAVAWRERTGHPPPAVGGTGEATARPGAMVSVVGPGVDFAPERLPPDLALRFERSHSGPDQLSFHASGSEVPYVVRCSYEWFVRTRTVGEREARPATPR